MVPILYIETNFALGVAKGQDPDGLRLLHDDGRLVRLVMPGVCYMESLKSFERERKEREVFIREHLEKQLREMHRDQRSEHAKRLVAYLEGAVAAARDALGDFENALKGTLSRLAHASEAIPLAPEIVLTCLEAELTRELADGLILQCVLRHAESAPTGPKAFLSGNSRHFGTDEVKEALAKVEVRYFPSCENALGWLSPQAGS